MLSKSCSPPARRADYTDRAPSGCTAGTWGLNWANEGAANVGCGTEAPLWTLFLYLTTERVWTPQRRVTWPHVHCWLLTGLNTSMEHLVKQVGLDTCTLTDLNTTVEHLVKQVGLDAYTLTDLNTSMELLAKQVGLDTCTLTGLNTSMEHFSEAGRLDACMFWITHDCGLCTKK